MTGTHEFTFPKKISVNCFVAPQGHFLGKASAFPQGAKLVNIPDIHCVLRLAFDDFNSHGSLAQTYSEVP
jgi:hypothetical protein